MKIYSTELHGGREHDIWQSAYDAGRAAGGTANATNVALSIDKAVSKERARCLRWAVALRMGELDDARSVIAGINSDDDFDEEEP